MSGCLQNWEDVLKVRMRWQDSSTGQRGLWWLSFSGSTRFLPGKTFAYLSWPCGKTSSTLPSPSNRHTQTHQISIAFIPSVGWVVTVQKVPSFSPTLTMTPASTVEPSTATTITTLKRLQINPDEQSHFLWQLASFLLSSPTPEHRLHLAHRRRRSQFLGCIP